MPKTRFDKTARDPLKELVLGRKAAVRISEVNLAKKMGISTGRRRTMFSGPSDSWKKSVGVMENTKLIDKRRDCGLTQVEVAKRAKIANRAYQNYENGKRTPRADVAIRIAKAVDSSVEELFGAATSDSSAKE